MEKDRKMAKREKKEKALIEKQRKQLADLSDEEAMMNDDVRQKLVKFKDDEESDDDDMRVDENFDDNEDKGIFLNPLLV